MKSALCFVSVAILFGASGLSHAQDLRGDKAARRATHAKLENDVAAQKQQAAKLRNDTTALQEERAKCRRRVAERHSDLIANSMNINDY